MNSGLVHLTRAMSAERGTIHSHSVLGQWLGIVRADVARHVKQTAMLAAVQQRAHSACCTSISMLATAYQVAQLVTMQPGLEPLVACVRHMVAKQQLD